MWWTTIRVMKGDTRSLDSGACELLYFWAQFKRVAEGHVGLDIDGPGKERPRDYVTIWSRGLSNQKGVNYYIA